MKNEHPEQSPPREPTKSSFEALDAAYSLISILVPVVAAVGKHDRSLKSQLQRAASSIPLNLNEGWGLQGGNKRARYLSALGSAREVASIVEVARRWRYISDETASDVDRLVEAVASMSYRL
ncbi:MAG: four helix bundle protein, partial [Myxococcota bacterium]